MHTTAHEEDEDLLRSLNAALPDQAVPRELEIPCVLWFDTSPHLSISEREAAASRCGARAYVFATEDEMLECASAHAARIREGAAAGTVRVVINSDTFMEGALVPRLRELCGRDLHVLVYSTCEETVQAVRDMRVHGVVATTNHRRCFKFVTTLRDQKRCLCAQPSGERIQPQVPTRQRSGLRVTAVARATETTTTGLHVTAVARATEPNTNTTTIRRLSRNEGTRKAIRRRKRLSTSAAIHTGRNSSLSPGHHITPPANVTATGPGTETTTDRSIDLSGVRRSSTPRVEPSSAPTSAPQGMLARDEAGQDRTTTRRLAPGVETSTDQFIDLRGVRRSSTPRVAAASVPAFTPQGTAAPDEADPERSIARRLRRSSANSVTTPSLLTTLVRQESRPRVQRRLSQRTLAPASKRYGVPPVRQEESMSVAGHQPATTHATARSSQAAMAIAPSRSQLQFSVPLPLLLVLSFHVLFRVPFS